MELTQEQISEWDLKHDRLIEKLGTTISNAISKEIKENKKIYGEDSTHECDLDQIFIDLHKATGWKLQDKFNKKTMWIHSEFVEHDDY